MSKCGLQEFVVIDHRVVDTDTAESGSAGAPRIRLVPGDGALSCELDGGRDVIVQNGVPDPG
jgi:hypothetical protein